MNKDPLCRALLLSQYDESPLPEVIFLEDLRQEQRLEMRGKLSIYEYDYKSFSGADGDKEEIGRKIESFKRIWSANKFDLKDEAEREHCALLVCMRRGMK